MAVWTAICAVMLAGIILWGSARVARILWGCK